MIANSVHTIHRCHPPILLVLAVFALLASACTPPEPPTASPPPTSLSQIIYQVRPEGGGLAHKEFRADGWVQGWRASPDEPQRIDQEQIQLSQAEVHAIWQAAYRLWEDPPEGPFILPENGEGYAELTLLTDDHRQLMIFWPFDEQHPDPKVRALVDLLAAQHVGGW